MQLCCKNASDDDGGCDSEQEVKEKNVWKWLLFCMYLRERTNLARKNSVCEFELLITIMRKYMYLYKCMQSQSIHPPRCILEEQAHHKQQHTTKN